MKESDAKNKKCPHHYTAHAIAIQTIYLDGAISPTDFDLKNKAVDAVNDRRILYCDGAECVMWESEYALVEHEQPRDKPMPDKGEHDIDWQKHQRAPGQPNDVWFRYVPTDKGDCGLKPIESGCCYPG